MESFLNCLSSRCLKGDNEKTLMSISDLYARLELPNLVVHSVNLLLINCEPKMINCMICSEYVGFLEYVKQNIFDNNLIKACSLNLYASCNTFCVEIGLLCETQ